jgi:hypothetical protein
MPPAPCSLPPAPRQVQNKVPGYAMSVEQVRMDLLYKTSYKRERMIGAYERLLLEALAGDRSHFVSPEELEASWRIFTPALDGLAQRAQPPESYAFGGRGPKGADALAKRYGMHKFGGGLTPYVLLGDRTRELAAGSKASSARAAQPHSGGDDD